MADKFRVRVVGCPKTLFFHLYFSSMTEVNLFKRRRLSPSQTAKKLLCKAYEPTEFPAGREGERLRWKHSDTTIHVMKKMLSDGYQILEIEARANGGRIDLIGKAPDGLVVGVEVKSHGGALREVDRIQCALYFSPQLDAVAVANRYNFEVLTTGFIQEVRVAAHVVLEFLATQPDLARVSFSPHSDVCGTCDNSLCMHRDNGCVQMRLDK